MQHCNRIFNIQPAVSISMHIIDNKFIVSNDFHTMNIWALMCTIVVFFLFWINQNNSTKTHSAATVNFINSIPFRCDDSFILHVRWVPDCVQYVRMAFIFTITTSQKHRRHLNLFSYNTFFIVSCAHFLFYIWHLQILWRWRSSKNGKLSKSRIMPQRIKQKTENRQISNL